MFNKPTSLPGLPSSKKSEAAADILIQHAVALAIALGITKREMAASALKLAVTIATEEHDPDGWLAMVLAAQKKDAI